MLQLNIIKIKFSVPQNSGSKNDLSKEGSNMHLFQTVLKKFSIRNFNTRERSYDVEGSYLLQGGYLLNL